MLDVEAAVCGCDEAPTACRYCGSGCANGAAGDERYDDPPICGWDGLSAGVVLLSAKTPSGSGVDEPGVPLVCNGGTGRGAV